MDNKGSLPPIIEDESDDNLMPHLYRKELARPEDNIGGNSLQIEDRSTPNFSSNSDIINGTQLPYSSWKTKFNFKRSDSRGDKIDMQSKLGQSLEANQNLFPPHTKSSLQMSGPNHSEEDSFNHRKMEPDNSGQTNFTGHNNYGNREKCLPFNGHPYNNSFNETPKGYFIDPKQKSYQEYGKCERQYVNYNHNYTLPDHFKHHAPEMPPNRTSYEKMSHHSFPTQNDSPISINSRNYSREYEVPPSCQNSCCNSLQAIHNSHNMSNFQSPYRNPQYSPEFQNKQIIKSTKSPLCDCHMKTELRDKKREKLDKVRKKQISDLYRIVWLQNEQIIQVQNQLKKLMVLVNDKNDEKLRRSHDAEYTPKISHKGTSEKRMFNLSVIEANQNLMEKVSVGIMTSFIDTTTVTKKEKNQDQKNKARKTKKSSISSSSSEDSSQTSDDEDVLNCSRKPKSVKKKPHSKPYEDSIILNGIEIPTVAENLPSNSSSPVHMEDYDSSSNSDESDTSGSEEDSSPMPVGWTFYDKVVGKVNNMLNKSESDSTSDSEVQLRTLEQLKHLGIRMDQESPSSKRVTFNAPCNERPVALPDSDTSMKMNALAVKYYKEDKASPDEDSYKAMERHQNNVAGNTNLSHATLRYLERYHLPKLTSQSPNRVEKEKKTKKKKEKVKKYEKNEEKKSAHKRKSVQPSGKILDITAIKQQPKLLPKKH